MTESAEKQLEDLRFFFEIKRFMFQYHDLTNGYPFKNKIMTKPFIKWLLDHGKEDFLLECEKRQKDLEMNVSRGEEK